MSFSGQVQAIKDEIITTTQQLIQLKSVETEALPHAPFGQGNREALDYVLALGKKWGFHTTDVDGYAGYIEFGRGEELVGILVHLDVVPEGENWSYPPFGGEIHDGKIYGRGSSDNKGSAVAALYAFKLVHDSGLPLKRRVRLIFGCDEESGFECIKHYLSVDEEPTLGFVPDATYPVIYGEKGVIGGRFVRPLPPGTPTLHFSGGTVRNVVPQFATATYDGKTYEAVGVPAHASRPELGVNAIIKLAKELSTFVSHPVLDFLTVASDAAGLGIALVDDISGPLTYNPAIIKVDSEQASLEVNIRYPVTLNGAEIIEQLKKAAQPFGFDFVDVRDSPPYLKQKDSFLVQTLRQVFTDVTGIEAEPQTIGGGTYARASKNCVAFGALFPGEPHVAHQSDEYVTIDSLIYNTEIFANAIYRLASEDEPAGTVRV